MNQSNQTPAPQMHAIYHVTEEEWQLFLLKVRYRDANLLTLSRDKPFLLEGAYGWLVYKGSADVFTARLENTLDTHQAVGARHHLFRANTDQLMIGCDLTGREVGLLVSCAPETQLLRVTLTRLQELAQQPEYTVIVAGMLDQWAVALSSGITPSVTPKEYLFIDAERDLQLEAGQIARTAKDVLWVSHPKGSSRFMSRQDVPPISGKTPTIMSRYTWLEATEPTTLEGLKTEYLLAADPEWVYLEAFNRLMLDCVDYDTRQRLAQEDQLIQTARVIDQARVRGAFSQLASTLNAEQARDSGSIDTLDPLLAACRHIGQVIGITFQSPPDLPHSLPVEEAVTEIARATRIRLRKVLLQAQWWQEDNGPLLAVRGADRDRHPVALLPLPGGRYELYDPLNGQTLPLNPTLAAELGRSAFMFYRALPERISGVLDLIRFGLYGLRQDALLLLGVGLAGGLLEIAVPLVTGTLFDHILPAGDRGQLQLIFAVLLISALAAALFQVTRSVALMRIEGKMTSSVQAAVWDRLLNLPVDFFRKYPAGDLTRRAMGINEIKELVSGTIVLALLSGIFSLFNLALLFYFDSLLALVATGIVAGSILVTVLLGQLLLRDQRRVAQLQGEISGLIAQLIGGIVKLRVAGAESRAFTQWANQFSEQKKTAFRARTVQNYLSVILAVYPVAASIAVFGLVYNRQTQSASPLTIGHFLAFYAAFTLFLSAGLQLSAALVAGLSAIPIYERMKPLLQAAPEVDDLKANPGELSGTLEVSHASFRYRSDGPLIVDDVSFSVRRGEFVALVGSSGSGKSTLLRLLLGFESPLSGAIYYDGQALTELDLRAVRRQIGVVLQYSQVVTGEILNNIIGSANLTIDDAWEAARLAGIAETINELPMGMHTYISEGGSTFSGGQKQRLLIARALVTRPRLIFFDEATSALDDKSQAAVTGSLKKLQATRIVIAHRLSTVVDADRILVLHQGKIAESGTYDELMSRGGLFAALIRRQLV